MATGKILECGLSVTMSAASTLGLRYVGHSARLDGFHVGVFEDADGLRWQVPCGTGADAFLTSRRRAEVFPDKVSGQGGLFAELSPVETEDESEVE